MANVTHRQRKRKLLKLEDVTDDMLLEILARLPARAAHRCKAVSKRWRSLISKPSFAEYHRTLHNDNNRFYLFITFLGMNEKATSIIVSNQVIRSFMPIHEDDLYTKSLLPSSWGLGDQALRSSSILFVSSDLLLVESTNQKNQNLVIYNAITKRELRLPPLPHAYDVHDMANFSGCLCSNDDPTQYKVVLVQPRSYDRIEWCLHIFIFSSDDGNWTEFVVEAPRNIGFRTITWMDRSQYAAICNGMLYWTNNMIVGYDPFNNRGQCDFIDFPDKSLDKNHVCIANVQGCIRVYDWRMTSTSTISFWDLDDYTNRVWSTKHNVDLGGINWYPNSNIYVGARPPEMSIKGFNPLDGDVVYLVLSTYQLVALNLTTKTVQHIFKFVPRWSYSSRLFFYVPPSWPTPL